MQETQVLKLREQEFKEQEAIARERWWMFLRDLDVTGESPANIRSEAEHAFKMLRNSHEQHYRFYHTLKYVNACLTEYNGPDNVTGVRHLAEHPYAVEWALWFHRITYRFDRKDTVVYSMYAAQYHAQCLGVQDKVRAQCLGVRAQCMDVQKMDGMEACILVTRDTDEPTKHDSQLTADITRVVLGTPQFADYVAHTKLEVVAWLFGADMKAGSRIRRDVDEDFRKAQLARFQFMLQRPTIYFTEHFQKLYEKQARENITKWMAANDKPLTGSDTALTSVQA